MGRCAREYSDSLLDATTPDAYPCQAWMLKHLLQMQQNHYKVVIY